VPAPVHTESGHNFVAAVNRGIEGLFGIIDTIIETTISLLPFILIGCAGVCLYWRKKKRGAAPIEPAEKK
jgi:uncharacterized membrane protein YuzA (DUF378 family)